MMKTSESRAIKYFSRNLPIWKEIKVGDRVQFRNTNVLGTILKIFLTEHPFYVQWDKGTEDWYKGEDLKKLNPEDFMDYQI